MFFLTEQNRPQPKSYYSFHRYCFFSEVTWYVATFNSENTILNKQTKIILRVNSFIYFKIDFTILILNFQNFAWIDTTLPVAVKMYAVSSKAVKRMRRGLCTKSYYSCEYFFIENDYD